MALMAGRYDCVAGVVRRVMQKIGIRESGDIEKKEPESPRKYSGSNASGLTDGQR
jgi:hypothetical protein